MEEFQSRLSKVNTSQELSVSTISDIFSLTTDYFGPAGEDLRKECSKANLAASLKKECCALVRSVVDRLLSVPKCDPSLVAETCTKLHALGELLANDMVLLLVVWKELFRIPVRFGESFRLSIDLSNLFSSLANNVRTCAQAWCDGLIVGENDPSTLTGFGRNAKILVVFMKFLCLYVSTFGPTLSSKQLAFTSSTMCAVFGAASAYRHCMTSKLPEDVEMSLSKLHEPLTALYLPGSAADLDMHRPLLESLSSDNVTVCAGSDARRDKPLAPATVISLGRLEILLFIVESHRATADVGATKRLQSELLLNMIFSETDVSFGYFVDSKVEGGDVASNTEHRIVQALSSLLFNALLTDSTLSPADSGSTSSTSPRSGGGLMAVLQRLCVRLADPHPLKARLVSCTASLFLASLHSQPPVQAAALRFMTTAVEDPCCSPALICALCQVIRTCVESSGSLTCLAQAALVKCLVPASELREVLFVTPVFVGPVEVCPPGLRLLTLVIAPAVSCLATGGEANNTAFSEIRTLLVQRCHDYAAILADIDQNRHTRPPVPVLVDLAVALLSSSSNGTRELCSDRCFQQLAESATRGSQAALTTACQALDALPPSTSLSDTPELCFSVSAALSRLGRVCSLGLGGSLDAPALLRAIKIALVASSRFEKHVDLTSSSSSSSSSASPTSSPRSAILVEASLALAMLGAVPLRRGSDLRAAARELIPLFTRNLPSNTPAGRVGDSVCWVAALRASLGSLKTLLGQGRNAEIGGVVEELSGISPPLNHGHGLLGILPQQSLSGTSGSVGTEHSVGKSLRSNGVETLKRKLKADAEAAVSRQDALSRKRQQASFCSAGGTWDASSQSFDVGICDGQPVSATFDGTTLTLCMKYTVSPSGSTVLPQPFESSTVLHTTKSEGDQATRRLYRVPLS